MAEFQEVMKELYRICVIHDCNTCPIMKFKDNINCNVWVKRHPEEVERIIMEWAAGHPIKTNRMKFQEVFGKDIFDSYIPTLDAWLDAKYKGEQDNDT